MKKELIKQRTAKQNILQAKIRKGGLSGCNGIPIGFKMSKKVLRFLFIS